MPKIFIRQCIKGQSESLRNIPKTFFLGCCCNLMLLDGIQKALFLLLKVSGQMMLVFFDIILCLVMDFSALDWKHSCCCCCCSAHIWMHLSIWLRIFFIFGIVAHAPVHFDGFGLNLPLLSNCTEWFSVGRTFR